jgi:hypothetical protein
MISTACPNKSQTKEIQKYSREILLASTLIIVRSYLLEPRDSEIPAQFQGGDSEIATYQSSQLSPDTCPFRD